MREPVFMKIGMYVMAPEPISTRVIKPSHHSVSIRVSSRWSVKIPLLLLVNVTAVTNTQVTIEELLDASFPM
jgi:hypothetical protein